MADRDGADKVVVLATGGTIAAAKAHGRAYQSGQLPANTLLSAVQPYIGNIRLELREIANIGSQDIGYTHWLALRQAIHDIIAAGDAKGIVITHGTDTLEETAFFLALVLQSPLPVVLTGAMRPPHVPGADGVANVRDAVRLASDPAAAGLGVLVVMDGKVFSPADVTKAATTGLSAFTSPNYGVLGAITDSSVWLPVVKRPWLNSVVANTQLPSVLPPVLVLYVHADMDVRYLEALLARRPAGVVVAGVGNGNMPAGLIKRLSRAVTDGIMVVRSSHTGSGRVEPNVEVDDLACGFVAAYGLNPQKARLLLQLLLLEGCTAQVAQAAFARF